MVKIYNQEHTQKGKNTEKVEKKGRIATYLVQRHILKSGYIHPSKEYNHKTQNYS